MYRQDDILQYPMLVQFIQLTDITDIRHGIPLLAESYRVYDELHEVWVEGVTPHQILASLGFKIHLEQLILHYPLSSAHRVRILLTACQSRQIEIFNALLTQEIDPSDPYLYTLVKYILEAHQIEFLPVLMAHPLFCTFFDGLAHRDVFKILSFVRRNPSLHVLFENPVLFKVASRHENMTYDLILDQVVRKKVQTWSCRDGDPLDPRDVTLGINMMPYILRRRELFHARENIHILLRLLHRHHQLDAVIHLNLTRQNIVQLAMYSSYHPIVRDHIFPFWGYVWMLMLVSKNTTNTPTLFHKIVNHADIMLNIFSFLLPLSCQNDAENYAFELFKKVKVVYGQLKKRRFLEEDDTMDISSEFVFRP